MNPFRVKYSDVANFAFVSDGSLEMTAHVEYSFLAAMGFSRGRRCRNTDQYVEGETSRDAVIAV